MLSDLNTEEGIIVKMIWILRTVFAFVVLTYPIHSLAAQEERWPVIKPEQFQYTLEESGSKSVFHLIKGKTGKPVYLFLAYLNAGDFENQDDYPLSGDFECIMIPLYEKVDKRWNLFFYYKNPSRMWDHRGRFFINQIDNSKQKSDYGWGKERVFRLRGIQVTIRVISYNLTPINEMLYSPKGRKGQKIESLKFELDIKNDPSAKSPLDERYQAITD
jgi:hypothetical protein